MRTVQSALDHRCAPQHSAECSQGDSIQRCMAAERTTLCLGGLGELGQLATALQPLAEPNEKPSSHEGITEPKRTQRQGQGYWETQYQAQGCCCRYARCRDTGHELQLLAVCTPCRIIASMAIPRRSEPESDASHTIRSQQLQQLGSAGPEERVRCSTQSGLPRHQCSSPGNSGAYRKDGQGHRAPGKGEHWARLRKH